MNAPHRTHARVRYGETDQMGVVYHANYIVYFELGRTEFMRAHDVHYASMEQLGMRLAVVEVGVRYLRGARYDEDLAIETRLTEASGVRVRFEYRVLRSGPTPDAPEELLAEGFTVLACVNADGRPTRIQQPYKDRIIELVGR